MNIIVTYWLLLDVIVITTQSLYTTPGLFSPDVAAVISFISHHRMGAQYRKISKQNKTNQA